MKYGTVVDEELELAKKEPPIRAGDLLLEILPLMEEYFVGAVTFDRNRILYEMPNGQKFLLTAQQQ